jgi:hypothetical protein
VVPVVPQIVASDPANPTEGKVIYKDVVFPEDMCAQGKGFGFGKTSGVVTTSKSGVPFASGLSPAGKVVSSGAEVPSFFQRVVVAWKPAAGYHEVRDSVQPQKERAEDAKAKVHAWHATAGSSLSWKVVLPPARARPFAARKPGT